MRSIPGQSLFMSPDQPGILSNRWPVVDKQKALALTYLRAPLAPLLLSA